MAHNEERLFVCNVCEKAYKTKSSLTTHYRTHTNIRHVCSKCGADFKTSAQLSGHHLRKH